MGVAQIVEANPREIGPSNYPFQDIIEVGWIRWPRIKLSGKHPALSYIYAAEKELGIIQTKMIRLRHVLQIRYLKNISRF